MSDYAEFLRAKRIEDTPSGLSRVPDINPMLFDWQADMVRWGLRRGRACYFADCGLGKSPMQLEWARHIPGRVLIFAPLAVAAQTEREGRKFGVAVKHSNTDTGERIIVTNYERMDAFDPSRFTGVVLDESGILKSFTGKTRTKLIEKWGAVPFRLCATATPAPNDFMELGNHAEFVGAMSRTEMLSMFFVHDGGETQKWRLKGHAQSEFWRWVCSWAVMLRNPADLGYDGSNYMLPPLCYEHVTVQSQSPIEGELFKTEARTLQERLQARRQTVGERVKAAAEIINSLDEPCIAWCNLNTESEALARSIPGSVEIRGSDSVEHKESAMLGFSDGKHRVIVTKPSIAGWGMNWQHCSKMVFVGLNDSFEQFYQAVRRCWRFGQDGPVTAYIVTSDLEGAVVANIERKQQQAEAMARQMVEHMHDLNSESLHGTRRSVTHYNAAAEMQLPDFLKSA